MTMAVEQERFDPQGFNPPWIRHEHAARFRFGADYVGGATVVDCACGTGQGTHAFATAGARHVYAYDISPEAARITADRCRGAGVSVSVGDAAALPLPEEFADVFISFETFEHLPQPDRLVREAHRVLKQGGTFLCSTPNRDVSSPGNTIDSRPWNRFHTKEYNTAEFIALAENVFGSCRVFGQNPVPGWRAATMRRIAAAVSPIASVRLNQAAKLPMFLFDEGSRHSVRGTQAGYEYEYIVIVCTK
ncbi:MAG TPA: methyltransferase domain-containing protein [Alphaproteobacteria bacterium]|nr:methyltransferase domain-containing protein [Alphaproteobacteria bacterium]